MVVAALLLCCRAPQPSEVPHRYSAVYRWLYFIGQLGQKRVWKGRGTGPRRGGWCRKGWVVEAEVAAAKHGGSDARHDRLCLDM